MVRRDGEDPAAFATDLEILAVRGFGDVGQKARTRMVRDRFILGQRNCGLRRHLDSVPPDTPIRDIVDRCRVWESHSDKNRRPPYATNVGRKYPAVVASDSRESSFYTNGSLRMATSPAFEPEVPVSVVQDVADDGSPIRGEWDRIVLDRSVNCGDSRELLSNTCDLTGIAGEPNVMPEFIIAVVQCASREELPTLVACQFSRKPG